MASKSATRLALALAKCREAESALAAAVAAVRAIEAHPIGTDAVTREIAIPFKIRDEKTGEVTLEMRRLLVRVPAGDLYRPAIKARRTAARRAARAERTAMNLIRRASVATVRDALALH